MNATLRKALVVAALVAAVAAVLLLRNSGREPSGPVSPPPGSSARVQAPVADRLPRLLDLGSTRCQACVQMEVVLAELRRDWAGKLTVDFIDVFDDPSAAEKHGVSVIPTQIFFDAAGTEVFRHTGFISAADILAAFRKNGVTVGD